MGIMGDEGTKLEQLRAQIGIERNHVVSHPVSASDIRKFAIAAYWPDRPPRIYWDEEYARTTRWGGIIAPEEFNPFAWPISGPGRLPVSPPAIQPGRTFNASSEAEYLVPIRPNDVITGTDVLVDAYERQGKSGRLLFLLLETRYTNQKDELVRVQRDGRVTVL